MASDLRERCLDLRRRIDTTPGYGELNWDWTAIVNEASEILRECAGSLPDEESAAAAVPPPGAREDARVWCACGETWDPGKWERCPSCGAAQGLLIRRAAPPGDASATNGSGKEGA